MIDAYKYDPITKKFIKKARIPRRRLSRKEPDKLLIIGSYTLTPPPKINNIKEAKKYRWVENRWITQEEIRGGN